jgi:hypothetical protein
VKPTAAPKTPAAKLRAAAKPKAPAKPKAAPKPKAPVLTPEQKKTAADAQKKTNFAQVAGKLSNPDVAKTLSASPDPLDTSALNDAGKQTLVSAGLGTQHTNGTVELNATGQALIRAMQSGDIAAANRLIAHAQAAQQDAAAKLAAQQAKKKVHKEFFIFKDAQGQYRWITFSSSSYEDKDGETIAQKALEDEVMRAERAGDYGPLCWWHMNGLEKGQPLVKLGDCDFSTMVGRVLVESGTFLNEMIAKAVERAAGILGTSIGFIPTPRTRGEGAVFKSIEIKERSLLPDFAASNYLANKVFVGKQPDQEVIMSKLTALKALFGGGKEADDLIASITSEAQIAEKAAKEQGLTYKQSQQSANQIDLATAILDQYGFHRGQRSRRPPRFTRKATPAKRCRRPTRPSRITPKSRIPSKTRTSKRIRMDAAPLDGRWMRPDGD